MRLFARNRALQAILRWAGWNRTNNLGIRDPRPVTQVPGIANPLLARITLVDLVRIPYGPSKAAELGRFRVAMRVECAGVPGLLA
jgi:hypothetical protein